MPYSAGENREDVVSFVLNNHIKSVLDVGPGAGFYSDILRPHVDRISAVEAWEPYVSQFNLDGKYDQVTVRDIREWVESSCEFYDLVIFGDVLEHMTAKDSRAVWKYASNHAKFGLISVPIVHYPQGAEFGNPYEVHVQEHMHPQDIRKDYGPFVFDREYEITGTFIKEF